MMKILSDTLLKASGPRTNTYQKTLTKEEIYGTTVSAIRSALSGKKVKRVESTSQDFGHSEADARLRGKYGK